MIPDKIRVGRICVYCEREFIDKNGNPFNHGLPTVCKECWKIQPDFNYMRACVETIKSGNLWTQRKDTYRKWVLMDTESDEDQIEINKKKFREERKAKWDEVYLPKFTAWLGDKIHWDGRKECYTLRYEKDGKLALMDFYPKRNRLLVRTTNKWYHHGAEWLVKNALPAEYCELNLQN